MEGATETSKITHDDITLNIIRYLNITDFSVIDRMTIAQYAILMDGKRLQKLDEMEMLHLLAYKIEVAKSTKMQGNKEVPVYPTFIDFFDKKYLETGVSSKAMDVDESEIDIYKLLSKT